MIEPGKATAVGSLAAELANVPLHSGNGDSKLVAPMAGKDLKTALKTAAVKSSRTGAKRVQAEMKSNAFDELFGKPQFVLRANVRMQDDKKIKGKKWGQVAEAHFNLNGSGIPLVCSITRNTFTRVEDDGVYEDSLDTIALPRSIVLPKDQPLLVMMSDAWRERMNIAYDEFIKTVNASMPVAAVNRSMNPRLVKSVKVQTAKPAK